MVLSTHQLNLPFALLGIVDPGCIFRVRVPHQALTLRNPAFGIFHECRMFVPAYTYAQDWHAPVTLAIKT